MPNTASQSFGAFGKYLIDCAAPLPLPLAGSLNPHIAGSSRECG
jgi:hypothetical protein